MLEEALKRATTDRDAARRFLETNISEDGVLNWVRFGSLGQSHALTHEPDKAAARQIVKEKLDAWKAGVFGENGRTNAVLLDATTLYTVDQLTNADADTVSPAMLLDLANFVTCCVLFDRIYFFAGCEANWQRLRDQTGLDIFTPIEVADFSANDRIGSTSLSVLKTLAPEQAAALWMEGHLESVRRDMGKLRDASPGSVSFEDRQRIVDAWTKLLGTSINAEELFDTSWISKRWSSMASIAFDHILEADNALARGAEAGLAQFLPDGLSDIVNEATYRARMYFGITDDLQIVYSPNTYRLPYRSAIYKRARRIQEWFPTIAAADDVYRHYARQYHAPERFEITLPFLLSGILAKVSRPDEILPEIGRLRDTLSAFRRDRTLLDKALRENRIEEVDRLRNVMAGAYAKNGYWSAGAPVAAATAAIVAAGAGGLTTMAMLSIFALTAGSMMPWAQYMDELKVRIFRPSYIMLGDVAAQARALVDAVPKINEVWGNALDRRYDDKPFKRVLSAFEALR